MGFIGGGILSYKLWIVRICIAFSVLAMFTLAARVWDWWTRTRARNVNALGTRFPILVTLCHLWIASRNARAPRMYYFGVIVSSIWLGVAVGKAFYICE